MRALPLLIQGKSRMRERACTDLCGGRSAMVVPTATVRPKLLVDGAPETRSPQRPNVRLADLPSLFLTPADNWLIVARTDTLTEDNMRSRISLSLVLALFLLPCLSADQSSNRVTILYDAFGNVPAMTKAWGFSALVEYGGKRILFDTGGNAEIFEHNVKALGVDLTKLDFVVLSHRHSDHISGLNYLLRVNPTVKIYAPADPWGPFGWSAPNSLYRKDESLAANMRYFDGNPPAALSASAPWPPANFVRVSLGRWNFVRFRWRFAARRV
jgi:hypothetical protein